MKNSSQKNLIVGLILILLINVLIPNVSATTNINSEIQGHWAEKTVTEWITKGYLRGYHDGTIKPNEKIKRGEFIALVNRAFQLKGATEVHFSDLSSSNWAYNDIKIAVKNNYVTGYNNGTVGVDLHISRQESVLMLFNLLKLNNNPSLPFTDSQEFAFWSNDAAGALAAKGIIKGYKDGSFHPNDSITRAEAVTLINQALINSATVAKTYDQAGNYGPVAGVKTIEGNVEVTAGGVTLKNLIINGDLLLDESIGEGDVTLDNVTVTGITTVRGGGKHSIHILNSVLLTVIVNKKDGTVRIVAEGTTVVKSVVVQSSAIIEESGVTSTGFSHVELAKELPVDSNIILHGTFDKVNVLATKISVSVPKGTIQQLIVAEGVPSSTITVDQLATIVDMVLNSSIKVLGQGMIKNVTANTGAEGALFEKLPTELKGQAKDKVTIQTPASSPLRTSDGSTSTPSNNSDRSSTESNTGSKSNNADLKALSVGDFTLYQSSNIYGSRGDAGFNPNVSYYEITTPIGYEATETTITIVPAEPHATVRVGIFDNENNNRPIKSSGILTEPSYTFTLDPKTVVDINISVLAADGRTSKYYTVHVFWERTFTEQIHIDSLYGAISGFDLPIGDTVRLYSTADTTTPIAAATGFAGGKFSLGIPDFQNLINTQGTLWLSFQKSGGIEGERIPYDYDLTPISNEVSASGIEIRPLNSEELFDFISPGHVPNIGKQFKVTFNKLDDSIASKVKYVHFNSISDARPFKPTVEDLKGTMTNNFFKSADTNGEAIEKHVTQSTIPWTAHNFVYFYDAEKNPLGYYDLYLTTTAPGAPLLNNVTSGRILAGRDPIQATSNKDGTLYLVSKIANIYDNDSIIRAAGLYTVSATANQAATISTVNYDSANSKTYLPAGVYQVYAIDVEGKVSSPSEEITVINYPSVTSISDNKIWIRLSFNKDITSFEINESTITSALTKQFDVNSPSTALIRIDPSEEVATGQSVTFTIMDADGLSQQYVAIYDGISWSIQANRE